MAINLPDFDDIQGVINEIAEVLRQKILLDIEIKSDEATVVFTITSDPKYLIGGKIPSMAQIESTWKFTGINGELISKRNKLAEVTSRLELLKLTYSLLQDKIQVWRSQVANERASIS